MAKAVVAMKYARYNQNNGPAFITGRGSEVVPLTIKLVPVAVSKKTTPNRYRIRVTLRLRPRETSPVVASNASERWKSAAGANAMPIHWKRSQMSVEDGVLASDTNTSPR